MTNSRANEVIAFPLPLTLVLSLALGCSPALALSDGVAASQFAAREGLGVSGPQAVGVEAAVVAAGLDEVSLEYSIKNRSARNDEAHVSFTFPAYRYAGGLGIPNTRSVRISVEGVRLPLTRWVKAYVWAGSRIVDVTSDLERCGVSIDDFGRLKAADLIGVGGTVKQAGNQLNSLSIDCRSRLEGLGAIGAGEDANRPLWSVVVSNSWKQEVPAGGTVRISVRFEPMLDPLIDRGMLEEALSESSQFRNLPREAQMLLMGEAQRGMILKLRLLNRRDGIVNLGGLRLSVKGSAACRAISWSPSVRAVVRSENMPEEVRSADLSEPLTLLFLCDR